MVKNKKKSPPLKKNDPIFVGRRDEIQFLHEISNSADAPILVIYGRRRVGKTALLENCFKDRNLIKIEGLENGNIEKQISHSLLQLSIYFKDPNICKLNFNSWTEFLLLLAPYVSEGRWTLYFEEVQWLACYQDQFVSELKYVYDNFFKNNKDLLIILCGSSPSFMLSNVIRSKALYNRSQHELNLQEFSIKECSEFLAGDRSIEDIFDAYLSVGGIPEYLKYIRKESSSYLALCRHSFKRNSFFLSEYDKIFTSQLATNKHYKTILEFVSDRGSATRDQILKHIKIKSGGEISKLLVELELCGFIEKKVPLMNEKGRNYIRYAISDNYIHFFNKFIRPKKKRITDGDFNEDPTTAINYDSYRKWMGFAFERFCRKNHHAIAKLLGFSAVEYTYGSLFSKDDGFQIDLIFDRRDRCLTICEVKYQDGKISKNIIDDFEEKVVRLKENYSKSKNKTIQKVLITNATIDSQLLSRGYFDRIINIKELF
ncbi:MAG: AAA family ATPase [Oligoflexia bacterium]|nr:AAA family ATPase [Oligoflexia bacterium]